MTLPDRRLSHGSYGPDELPFWMVRIPSQIADYLMGRTVLKSGLPGKSWRYVVVDSEFIEFKIGWDGIAVLGCKPSR